MIGLRRLEQDWQTLGATDPMWAILSAESRRGGGWERHSDEFFQSGVTEVAHALDAVKSLRPDLQHDAALDFGCGIGRVTRALAQHFEHVVGVDIAQSMVDRARSSTPVTLPCEFTLNTRPDLAVFPDESFDFVYSRIVLQHVPRTLAVSYIGEFVRVLRSGGCAMFQVTTAPGRDRSVLRRAVPRLVQERAQDVLHRMGPPGRIRVFCHPPRVVTGAVSAASGLELARWRDDSCPGYESFVFVVGKG